MFLKTTFIFNLLLILHTPIHAIIAVSSVCDGLAKYTDLTSTDLIVFDLDDTLIQSPKNSSGKPVPLHKRVHVLIDARLPELFQVLHKNKIPVIALTHARTGAHKEIKSMENWRYQHTSALGLIFTHTKKTERFSLTSIQAPHPVCNKGIIHTAHHPKGLVLTEYLKIMQLKPKRIFFFDDKINNIYSVQKALSKTTVLHCFHVAQQHANTSP